MSLSSIGQTSACGAGQIQQIWSLPENLDVLLHTTAAMANKRKVGLVFQRHLDGLTHMFQHLEDKVARQKSKIEAIDLAEEESLKAVTEAKEECRLAVCKYKQLKIECETCQSLQVSPVLTCNLLTEDTCKV